MTDQQEQLEHMLVIATSLDFSTSDDGCVGIILNATPHAVSIGIELTADSARELGQAIIDLADESERDAADERMRIKPALTQRRVH